MENPPLTTDGGIDPKRVATNGIQFHYRWFLAAVIVVVPLGYFSWTADPAMVRIDWLPVWLARWADDYPILRTGAALVPAGGLLGIWLVRHQRPLRDWWLGALVLVSLVAVAELGQLLQPRRVCDAKDFLAGSGGALAGMLLAYLVWLICTWLRRPAAGRMEGERGV